MRLPLLLLMAFLAAPASAQPVWYVDADAIGANTGASWADAFTDLQSALAVAEAGEEVWVAEGTYTLTSGSDRTVSFVLTSGVALYGGFAGTEQSRDERDWTIHTALLSGNIGDPANEADNSYHVVTAVGTSLDTALDGLSVAHGRADGAEPDHDRGGGVLLRQGDMMIRNAHLFRNDAYRGGGSLHVEAGAPIIEASLFEDSRGIGGGAYFTGSAPEIRDVVFRGESFGPLVYFGEGSTGLIEDTVIEENDAVGLVIEGSSPRFIRVIVRNNHLESAAGGGAIIEDEGAAPVFEDCLFEGNAASSGAAVSARGLTAPLFLRTTFRSNLADGSGAVYTSNASPTFLFCRFERNRSRGPGAISSLGSAVTVIASTFVGNTSFSGGAAGGALSFTGSTFTGEPVVIASSLFSGNEANWGGAIAAFGVGSGDALVVNSAFAGNEGREAGGAIYASNAPGLVVQNSVLWGNAAPEGPEVYVAQGAPPMIAQSLVAGGYPSGTMILDADPLFVRNPDPGPDGRWGTADDDYGDLRLLEGSPAVDYGLAAYLPADTWDLDGDGDTEEPLPVDLAGGPRVLGEAPDLGAYEGGVRVANEPGGLPEEPGALRVWPNPARGRLHIEDPGSDEAVVYDVLGREVLRAHLDGVTEADVSGLAAGVYLVRVGGRAAVVTVRR